MCQKHQTSYGEEALQCRNYIQQGCFSGVVGSIGRLIWFEKNCFLKNNCKCATMAFSFFLKPIEVEDTWTKYFEKNI